MIADSCSPRKERLDSAAAARQPVRLLDRRWIEGRCVRRDPARMRRSAATARSPATASSAKASRIEDGVFIGHGVMFTNDLYPRAVNADGQLQTDADWQVVTRASRRAHRSAATRRFSRA